MDISTNEFDQKFHYLLGRLVRAHSNFDYNVGLQLNWLGRYYGESVEEVLNPLKPFSERLKLLKRFILNAFQRAGEGALSEFKDWFRQAHELKGLRNDYLHGRWGLPANYSDTNNSLRFTPLHWDTTGGRADETVSLTLEESAAQVKSVEKLIAEYHSLFNKYSTYSSTYMLATISALGLS